MLFHDFNLLGQKKEYSVKGQAAWTEKESLTIKA